MFKKFLLISLLYLVTPKSVYAAVDLGSNFAFGSVRSLGDLISYLVPTAFIVAGLMFAFYFMTACWDYINSQGDKNAVSAARQKIEHSVIGLILLIAAFVVVRYMPTALGLTGMRGIFGN